ncbi:hypothetical protein B0T17DRAFT_535108 [Bombardia bombarda]|uniref:Uncharacterized protein n=1 Tax=Bombardia bombarda TaxID=252184 RepID=A0AA40C1X6_9PEZI|nr:hypothetical protein B0T17DRAFT_535108 [Bombardia bombarda]
MTSIFFHLRILGPLMQIGTCLLAATQYSRHGVDSFADVAELRRLRYLLPLDSWLGKLPYIFPGECNCGCFGC